MTKTLNLNDYAGSWLPSGHRASFMSPASIASWLELQGYEVHSYGAGDHAFWANTALIAGGPEFQVSSNGYVHKFAH